MTPEDVRAALEARDRKACGPVAPPDGLYFMQVDYPDVIPPRRLPRSRRDRGCGLTFKLCQFSGGIDTEKTLQRFR